MDARECAYYCLKKVFNDNAYVNLVLKKQLDEFSGRDASLITKIVYGTIQNYRLLTYQWEHLANKSPNKNIAILLNMSCYQLLMMDKVPSYAVIDEANKLAGNGAKGFVNAILHKVLKQGLIYSDKPSINYSVEDWLLSLFKAHYPDNYEEILKSYLEDSITYGLINPLVTNKLDVKMVDDEFFIVNSNLINSDSFKNGEFIIQDYASGQVVKQLDLEPGLKVLDVCSAPGTKACNMAFKMQNVGKIVACDLYERRVNLIQEATERLHLDIISPMVNDATILNSSFVDIFDRVLLDAPCSGLGVLRRKPDIKLTIKPENIDEIVELQRNILEITCQYVKVNGVLVYSTCTLNKKENEKQIASFLKRHEEFKLIEETTILPFKHDGFYHAKLVRIK